MHTIKRAAERALGVLNEVKKSDESRGVADCDVLEAIEMLELAFKYARGRDRALTERKQPRPRANNWGIAPLEALYVNQGKHKGATGRFLGVAGATSIYLATSKGRLVVDGRYVERVS